MKTSLVMPSTVVSDYGDLGHPHGQLSVPFLQCVWTCRPLGPSQIATHRVGGSDSALFETMALCGRMSRKLLLSGRSHSGEHMSLAPPKWATVPSKGSLRAMSMRR